MNKQTLILFCIIIVAFFLRIYRVTQIPPSLSWDEVSIGYNAYSIYKTGYDEHHRFLPLDAFAAFGDYKPPLAVYVTVPFIALFGLSELAVRLPSVLFGTLTVLVCYFLVKELFRRSSYGVWLAILAALLLAISPWHIQLSRAGFEANIATFFVVLGAWMFLRARRNPKLFIFAFVPFVAAVYTFNSARYFAPLLAVVLTTYCWKEIRSHRTSYLSGIVLGSLLMLPILSHLVSAQARQRFTEVNIFTDATVVNVANERIAEDGNTWWAKIVHNRRIGFARSYLIHLFDNLEPSFLFIRGDGNPKFSIQDTGQLYIVEIPFLVLGIYWLLTRQRRTAWLLSVWLLGALLPAAVARETPHALRIENSLPVWQIIIACGLLSIVFRQPSSLRKKIVIGIFILLYMSNFSYYWHNYYQHYAKEYSGEWQYGYREAIQFASSIIDRYDNIILSENIGRPYIYVAFYEKLDPRIFWKTIDGSFDAAGFYNAYRLGKYQFVREGVGSVKKGTLYILAPNFVPAGAHVLRTITLLNGKPILTVFDAL